MIDEKKLMEYLDVRIKKRVDMLESDTYYCGFFAALRDIKELLIYGYFEREKERSKLHE